MSYDNINLRGISITYIDTTDINYVRSHRNII
jgi:hypothetical protein